MAAQEFLKALPRILVYEGGKVDDPYDPGGRTAYGVTQRVYTAWRRSKMLPVRDVYLIEKTEINELYKLNYWDKIAGDRLPEGVAFVVFDAAVNSGIGQATKWLQRALGDRYLGQQDGHMGNQTVEAALDHEDHDQLVADYCAHRLGMLKGLRTWGRYGKGWGARIANVQKIGQAWASGSVGPNPINVEAMGGNHKAVVADVTKPIVGTSIANGTSGLGIMGTGVSQMVEQISPLKDTSKVLLYVFIGLTVLGVLLGVLAAYLRHKQEHQIEGCAKEEVNPEADEGFEAVAVNDNEPDPAEGKLAA